MDGELRRRLLPLRPLDCPMLFDLGVCDSCGKPATTALHHDGGSERYCEEHWIESRSGLVRQAVCVDCEKVAAVGVEE